VHSPLTVAHEIRTPIPKVERRRAPSDRPRGPRWSAHWYLADKTLYFPPLVTIWHREPDDQDSGTVCTRDTNWRWHFDHWEYQIHPVQKWRRRIMTRCAECGGRSTKKDPVNCSLQWENDEVPWWYPEPGLYHQTCSSKARARTAEQHQARDRTKTWDQYRAQIAILNQAATDLTGVGEPEAAGWLQLEATRIRMTLEREAAEVTQARRDAAAAREQEATR
jgi:hypothetical protein